MSTSVDSLNLRRVFGRYGWLPPEPFGPDGWRMVAHVDRMPAYDDPCLLHAAVFGEGYAFQVFAPSDRHVNIHEHALHLWGRRDGANPLPDFGAMGSI